MSQVTIHQAQTQLSRLIQKVLAGEEIVIVKNKAPVVKLVAFRNGSATRTIGADKGLVKISKDFNLPLDDFKEYML